MNGTFFSRCKDNINIRIGGNNLLSADLMDIAQGIRHFTMAGGVHRGLFFGGLPGESRRGAGGVWEVRGRCLGGDWDLVRSKVRVDIGLILVCCSIYRF